MKVERIGRVGAVGEAAWGELEAPSFPFTDYAFLTALEESGAATRASGWEPWTLVAREEGSSRPCGAALLYRKTNSLGEYIFDWEWARFYQRFGGRYYPKLTAAVPFTPATGAKLLVRQDLPEAAREAVRRRLAEAIDEELDATGASSFHALFTSPEDAGVLAERGWLVRDSFQYHWRNRGYGSFDEFLAALTGKRRRQIVRERRTVAASGIRCESLTGEALTPELATAMHAFYAMTIERKDAIPYLDEAFFRRVFDRMRDRILLTVAYRGDELVAAALNFFKGQHLYGRYWGAREEFRHLHFELCYYRTIDFAIARGMTLFEAGAQGEHKLARGFLPSRTLSVHAIRDQDFARAIAVYVAEERALVAAEIAAGLAHSPYG